MISDEIAEEPPLPEGAEQKRAEIGTIRSKVTGLEEQARRRIRQRPVVAVLAAVGTGYLAARLVSRAIR